MNNKAHRTSRGDLSYVIHSQTEMEKSFSDDIGNTYEVVEMKKKNSKELPHGVWKYFSFAKNICDGSGDKVVCTLCFEENEVKTYSRVTSSSNLWRHLQQKHGIYEDTKVVRKEEHKELETEAAICEMLREEGDDGMTFMEEVVVGSEKDMDEATDGEEKFTVTSGDINVSIIEEIFKHPEIFDHKNCKATKQDRDLQWDTVAAQFKGTVDIEHIKKVWKNIRDRYKKLRNKELRTGIVQPPEKRYKYYDLLNELDVTGALCGYEGQENSESDRTQVENTPRSILIKKRRRSSNEEEFTDVEYLHDRNQFNEIDDGDPLFEELEEINIEPALKTIKMEEKSIVHADLPSKSQIQPSSSSIEDEFTLFGKLVAEKLRRMPRQKSNRLEMKVMTLLLLGND